MLKWMYSLLVVMMAFVVLPGESLAKSFSDVRMDTETGRAIDYLSERGVVSGYSDGTFRPGNDVTRAQAAKIVAGALKMESFMSKNPEVVSEYPEDFRPQPFRDLATTNAYFEPVIALREWGAMVGYDDNTFKPNNQLTRAQIAKILTRAYALPSAEYAPRDKVFRDVDRASERHGFIQTMYALGVMPETSAGYFSPDKRVTRGELALYIYRLDQHFKQVEQETGVLLNAADSLVAELYAGTSVMAQPIYQYAPMHAVRMLVDETFNFSEVEGGHCSSYDLFSLCGGYVWEGSEVVALFIDGTGYSVADLEQLVGEPIAVDVFLDGPMPYSFMFEYNGLKYSGETAGPNRDDAVLYLIVNHQ